LCVYDANISAEDMRMLVAALEKKQPGFYFVYTIVDKYMVDKGVLFYTAVSSEFANIIDMKQFGEWLQTQGLRGGGSKNSIQGGGEQFDPQLGAAIKQWIQNS
jgi:hypothetical protein